jgi:hypothetical protein
MALSSGIAPLHRLAACLLQSWTHVVVCNEQLRYRLQWLDGLCLGGCGGADRFELGRASIPVVPPVSVSVNASSVTQQRRFCYEAHV